MLKGTGKHYMKHEQNSKEIEGNMWGIAAYGDFSDT